MLKIIVSIYKSISIILFMILLLVSKSISHADTYDMISQLGSSARHIAIGNVDGFSMGADNIFENPAGLYRINTYALNLFSSKILWDTTYSSMAIAGAINNKSVWAVGIYELLINDFDYTNEDSIFLGGPGDWYAQPLGTFDIKNSITKFAYQYSKNLDTHFGFTTNIYSQKMVDCNGQGWDIDLGAIYQVGPFETITTIKNILGNKMHFSNNATETLPRIIQTSSHFLVKNIHFFPQIALQNKTLTYSIGAETSLWFFPQLKFMGGYKTTLNNANEKAKRFSAGIGLDLQPVSFFYAYEKGDVIGFNNQHYFSIEFTL